ncbi:hypothetical protein AT245_02870 [Bartonella henselae]|nr:hypothetical protein AT244_05115 [Bartonella henselae]OLL43221.1 hypothetical protein AT245_02870 [Bartonella henselae]
MQKYSFIHDVNVIKGESTQHPTIQIAAVNPDGPIDKYMLIEVQCPRSEIYMGIFFEIYNQYNLRKQLQFSEIFVNQQI